MKSGDLVSFPDDPGYVYRGKLFLILKFFQWESPYNGAVFKEVDALELGTQVIRKFRVEHLVVISETG